MKLGRNDICNCGSGLKYKKCCITIDASAPSKNPVGAKHYASFVRGQDYSPFGAGGDEPERYLGYSTERADGEDAFSHSVEGLCCMVTNITKKTQSDAQTMSGKTLPLGSWIVTNRSPASKHLSIDGPFEDMQQAYDFGRAKYGVVRYKAMQL